MKRSWIHSIVWLMLIGMCLSSCEESDNVQNYAYNDNLAFGKAKSSYAEKFKVLWSALNANYALWDYEESQGLNWDRVYDTYLPQFAALDTMDHVSDAKLKALMTKVLSPLHDGHLSVQLYNHKTKKYLTYAPSSDRNAGRVKQEGSSSFEVNLAPYKVDGLNEIIVSKEVTTIGAKLVAAAQDSVLAQINAELQSYEQQAVLSDLDSFRKAGLEELQTEMKKSLTLTQYNQLVTQYAYLNLSALQPIDSTFSSNGLTVRYALFRDNIAYLQFNAFHMTTYLNSSNRASTFGSISAAGQEKVAALVDVWQSWFDTIQVLHQNGQLGGVIIDVRTNGGGYTNDYKYALGSLLPSGGQSICYSRFKRGTGRYDYSPLMPLVMATYSDQHETVDDCPIVVLCNASSASMSEMTSRGVKLLPNGKLIGTRTAGALSALHGTGGYSEEYAGIIGVKGTTPVYAYIPAMCTFSADGEMDHEQLEGYGITPDIEVALDHALLKSEGRDTQLERALKYIRTGN